MRIFIIVLGFLFSISSFGQLIDGENLRKQKYYDSTLNNMRLRDAKSIEKAIGTADRLVDDDEKTEVTNKNDNQILTMIFLPGDAMNQFSQFMIEYNSTGIKSNLKINAKEFVSGKGVKLGITEPDLVAALGRPKEKKNDKSYVLYSYKQDNGLYFGLYWFKNGKLEKFWFGEEYP